MKFGYVVPNNFGIDDPAELVALAAAAENLGFSSVWVNHHVLNVGYVRERLEHAPYHDALVTLTWIGAATSKVKLGTSVLVMPYLHPMVLAKELATLDQLSGGRLVVGLGVGSNAEEHDLIGMVPYGDRGRYSNEFIAVLKSLWADGSASFEGEFFSFNEVIASPKPMQRPHPMILTGGNRPPAIRRAGQLADGWHGMNLRPDSVGKRVAAVRDAALQAGRAIPAEYQLRMDMRQITQENLREYIEAGVTEMVVSLGSGDVGENRQALEQFARDYI